MQYVPMVRPRQSPNNSGLSYIGPVRRRPTQSATIVCGVWLGLPKWEKTIEMAVEISNPNAFVCREQGLAQA